jgi:hypothetical protein
LKRASTRFWPCASALAFAFACILSIAGYSQDQKKSGPRKRVNEFTLGGLRPGRSTFGQARELYRAAFFVQPSRGTWSTTNLCTNQTMEIETFAKVISSIRIQTIEPSHYGCGKNAGWHGSTGKGLRIGDVKSRVVALYGAPDSVSPSTKNGQPLELLYYAFDWAGPDVPQVMEVVCTAPKDGSSGHVVEIMLAAGSL